MTYKLYGLLGIGLGIFSTVSGFLIASPLTMGLGLWMLCCGCFNVALEGWREEREAEKWR